MKMRLERTVLRKAACRKGEATRYSRSVLLDLDLTILSPLMNILTAGGSTISSRINRETQHRVRVCLCAPLRGPARFVTTRDQIATAVLLVAAAIAPVTSARARRILKGKDAVT